MKSGMTSSQVADNIMASDEYKNRQSTTPDVANFDSSGNVVVRRNAGDTLQSLARKAYGDSSLWYLIAEANGVTFNADLSGLKTIVIPDAPVAGSAAPAGSVNPFGAGVGNTAASDSASKLKDRVAQAIQNVMIGPKDPVKDTFGRTPIPSTIVQYQSGDTLDSLAQKAYGDSSYWRLIAAKNDVYSDADLSKLGSIAIPDLSVLELAGGRAENFMAQLQAQGFNAQGSVNIVGPARASGASQGALDYANEMAAASMGSNAVNEVWQSAYAEGRMAAAMYLLTNSGATDAQLYVEYMRDFSWALDGGMSDLARQANGALAGERMGDFLAMAAGGFGSDGPDFGRADRYEQEMQAWSDAFKVKDKKPSLEELFGRKPSVPDLGETDLGKLPVNLPSQNEPIYNQSGSMANTSEPAIQQVVVKGVKAESDQTYENYDPISPSLSPSQSLDVQRPKRNSKPNARLTPNSVLQTCSSIWIKLRRQSVILVGIRYSFLPWQLVNLPVTQKLAKMERIKDWCN
jgi:phage tail protein X